MSPAIKMFGDKILIEKRSDNTKLETKTNGGIIIPASVQQEQGRTKWGTALRVGVKAELVKEGDEVMYDMYSSTSISVDGVEYIIVREQDLVCART